MSGGLEDAITLSHLRGITDTSHLSDHELDLLTEAAMDRLDNYPEPEIATY